MHAQTERTEHTGVMARRTCRRRGVALLLVLVVAAVAITLSYSFVTEQSVGPQMAHNVEVHAQARGVAESGLRLAIAYITKDTDWRTNQSQGTWVSDASLGGGTFTVVGEDGEDTNGDGAISVPAEGDGNLADDPTDLLTLTVTGSFGGTKHIVRAVAKPMESWGDILFVVGDAANLTTADTVQKSLVEQWGWTVSVLDDGASSSAFDTAVAASTVGFVAESASAGAVGTKLTFATIGVVLEVMDLGDEFGLTEAQDTQSSRYSINVVDNTHYITSSFSIGTVDMFTANQTMHRQSQTLAGGASVLAEHPVGNKPTLYVVDAGGALYGGGSAIARRVQLPWGLGADYATLTADGKTVLQRALEWASQGTPSAISHAYQVHWRN